MASTINPTINPAGKPSSKAASKAADPPGGPAAVWTLQCVTLTTPLGRLEVVCDGDGQLRGVDWEDGQGRLLRLLSRQYRRNPIRFDSAGPPPPAAEALQAYFAGDLSAIDRLRVEPAGTPFQQRVWQALRVIPAGMTLSYAGLAARLGQPAAARAVGAANGANPVSVIIPCHRLVGSDRGLTGYAGGVRRKAWLLAHEGAAGWA